MGISYNPSIVTDGLVLCLDAANRRSYPGAGTIWTDLSGNGNNGTLTNGPTFSGANGGSIVFDGTNDYVQINPNSSLQISTGVTATSVVKVTGSGTNRARLLDTARSTSSYSTGAMIYLKIGTDSSNDISWFIVGNNAAEYEVRKSTSVITSTIIPYIITARWRKSDGKASIFVNGVEVSYASTVTFTGTVETLSNPLMIGLIQYFNIYGNQTIYATHLYNRYLNDNEILQNYNATKGRYL